MSKVQPIRLAIKKDRPFIFLDYQSAVDGKLRRRSIPVRRLWPADKQKLTNTGTTEELFIDDIVGEMKVRHLKYLQSVHSEQLKRIILKLIASLTETEDSAQITVNADSNTDSNPDYCGAAKEKYKASTESIPEEIIPENIEIELVSDSNNNDVNDYLNSW